MVATGRTPPADGAGTRLHNPMFPAMTALFRVTFHGSPELTVDYDCAIDPALLKAEHALFGVEQREDRVDRGRRHQ